MSPSSLAAWLAAAVVGLSGNLPADSGANPTEPIHEGWRFQVQRRVQLAGTQTRDGLESAVRYSVELRFVEHTVRVENGRARETGFRILKAHETRQGETVEVAAPGTEYVLMTGPSVYQMKDPATGQAFQNQELHRVMGGNLPFELWPGKPLTQGLAWAFRGQDLARRLAPLGVLDGRINLRVASIGPEPNTGLQTARIIGRFNGQVESGNGISMDYITRVEIHLPLRLGIPFHFEFTGPVSYSVQTQSDGRQQNTIFNGQYDFVQSSSPSRTVLAALDAADAAATAAAADSDVDRRDEEGATPLMMAALNSTVTLS